MLNRSFPQGRNILLGTTCLGLLMSCSPSSETSTLSQYAGTYATTTMVIDGETVDAAEYGLVGLALKPKGNTLVGSLLVGFPEDAFSFGVLSMKQGEEGIAGEYWLPTFAQDQTEEVNLALTFDEEADTIDLQFTVTDPNLEIFPEIFSTPDGAGSEVQLVVQKLTEDNAASFNSSPPVDNAIENEGKQILGAMNRGQQAFFLENETFAGAIADLGLGIAEETDNYLYEIHGTELDTEVHMYATPKVDGVKSYVSSVFIATIEGEEIAFPNAILCESDETGIPTEELPYPSLSDGEPTCPEGFTAL